MYLLNLCYKEKIIINILLIIFMFHGCKNVDVEKPWNEGENLSLYIVTRTTSSIKIDGKLDELDWKNAVEAPLKNTLNGEEVPLKTTVKFLWDDIYLYVGFYCEDPDAWANYTKEDDYIKSIWLKISN